MTEETLEVIKKALEPKPGVIMVYCAWCRQFIEAKSGEGITGKSHGICSRCSEELRKELSK